MHLQFVARVGDREISPTGQQKYADFGVVRRVNKAVDFVDHAPDKGGDRRMLS